MNFPSHYDLSHDTENYLYVFLYNMCPSQYILRFLRADAPMTTSDAKTLRTPWRTVSAQQIFQNVVCQLMNILFSSLNYFSKSLEGRDPISSLFCIPHGAKATERLGQGLSTLALLVFWAQ